MTRKRRESATRALVFVLGVSVSLMAFTLAGTPRPLWEGKTAAVVNEDPVDFATLECLSPDAIERVRTTSSLTALFERCRSELIDTLGGEFADLTDQDLRAVLSALVANRMAPYGESHARSFAALLAAPALACNTYAALAGHLFGGGKSLHIAGFHGGGVGNHTQLVYEREDVRLLLDPSVALVARVSFDSLMRGEPVTEHNIRRFHVPDPFLDSFESTVYRAINRGGAFTPSTLLYYCESIEHFVEVSSLNADDPRRLWLVTPGGMKLREDMEGESARGSD